MSSEQVNLPTAQNSTGSESTLWLDGEKRQTVVGGERSVSPEVGSWPKVGELASKQWAKLHEPEVV